MGRDDSDLINAFALADGYDFTKYDVEEIEDRAGKIVSLVNKLVEEHKPSKVTIGSYANIGLKLRELTLYKSLKGEPIIVELCTCGRDLHVEGTTYNINTGERSLRNEDGFNPL